MSKSKNPSFDGRDFNTFVKSQFGKDINDYSYGRPGEAPSPTAQDNYNQDFAIYAATGRGGAGG